MIFNKKFQQLPILRIFLSLVMLPNILMTISEYAGKGKKIIGESPSVTVSFNTKEATQ